MTDQEKQEPTPTNPSPAPTEPALAVPAPKKSYRNALLAVAILLLIILWQAGVFQTGKIAPDMAVRPGSEAFSPKETRTVAAQPIPIIYEAVGTITSRDLVEVSSRLTARILELTLRSGDRVKKGDLIARLDDKDIRQDYLRAKANLDEAEKNYRRTRELREQNNVVSQAELDTATRLYETAKAAVSQSEAVLEYATITAPSDGVISEKLASQGDMAIVGKPILRLFDPTRMMLEANVREDLLPLALKLLPTEKNPGQSVDILIDAYRLRFVGEMKEVVPNVDQGSRTFVARICLGETPQLKPGQAQPETLPRLIPGMFGRLELAIGEKATLLVPPEYLVRSGQLEYLWIKAEDGWHRNPVRSVPAPEGRVEILTGLKEGETIGKP